MIDWSNWLERSTYFTTLVRPYCWVLASGNRVQISRENAFMIQEDAIWAGECSSDMAALMEVVLAGLCVGCKTF